MSQPMIEIDGAFGEGGGQILRSSLSLSALTGRPFRLYNVRAGRAKPGLQPQHLASVRAGAAICGAQLRGAALHSMDLTFEPGPIAAGDYQFPIGTAGATSLVLHTVYLPLALRGGAASNLTLEGGTHVDHSPCFHFLDITWRRYLEVLGLDVRVRMKRPGFYPRGGGRVDVEIRPCSQLHGLKLAECSPLGRVRGFSAVAGLPETIAQRQAHQAAKRLKRAGLHAEINEETWAGGPGTVLGIVLDTRPAPVLFFGIGARGKPAERVADEAAEQALAYLDSAPAAVDPHSADQLVLPLALAEGASDFTVSEVTHHLTTNIAVIRRFLDRDIVCEGAEGEPGRVHINS